MLKFSFPELKRCAGKTAHMTPAAATKELKRSAGKRMGIFKCEHCEAYHIGHDTAGSRRHSNRDRRIPIA